MSPFGIFKSKKEQSPDGEYPSLSEGAQAIVNKLKCPYEVLKAYQSVEQVMAKYRASLETGKTEGYTPLIIIPSEHLEETLAINEEDNGTGTAAIQRILAESQQVDAAELLRERYEEYTEDEEEETLEYDPACTPADTFLSLIDYRSKTVIDELILAKIPNTQPWELAAYVPMGGYNECPAPDEQVAVFHKWYEQYRAYPAVVSYDIWECYVENPPVSFDETIALGKEQYGFCNDVVDQGVGSVSALVSGLVGAHTWYFWWD